MNVDRARNSRADGTAQESRRHVQRIQPAANLGAEHIDRALAEDEIENASDIQKNGRDYEKRNANRKSVLSAIESKLA